jgi:hypothetical protein
MVREALKERKPIADKSQESKGETTARESKEKPGESTTTASESEEKSPGESQEDVKKRNKI